MENFTVAEWQKEFLKGTFESNDRHTQIKAGWYDWFCRDESLRNKTKRMGKIISQIKRDGKINFDDWYVWFKNNCPLNGPLYDDFRFADSKTGNVMFTVQLNCCWNKHRYTVYGRKNNFDEPLFECDDSRELVKWLNKKWED